MYSWVPETYNNSDFLPEYLRKHWDENYLTVTCEGEVRGMRMRVKHARSPFRTTCIIAHLLLHVQRRGGEGACARSTSRSPFRITCIIAHDMF